MVSTVPCSRSRVRSMSASISAAAGLLRLGRHPCPSVGPDPGLPLACDETTQGPCAGGAGQPMRSARRVAVDLWHGHHALPRRHRTRLHAARPRRQVRHALRPARTEGHRLLLPRGVDARLHEAGLRLPRQPRLAAGRGLRRVRHLAGQAREAGEVPRRGARDLPAAVRPGPDGPRRRTAPTARSSSTARRSSA